jgi:2-keto-4-pentenoate hydratase
MKDAIDERLQVGVDALANAYLNRTRTAPLSERVGELSIEDAFAVQAAVLKRRALGGCVSVRAIKAGLLDPPLLGSALAEDIVPDRGSIQLEDLFEPLLEPEVAFVIGEPLSGDGLTVADVLHATEAVIPAFEIVDRRIVCDGMPPINDIIADNGWLGMVILGDSAISAIDTRAGTIAVELQVDGRVVEHGQSELSGVHPAKAVAVVAALLHRIGLGLEPGHAVLTGACTRPYRVTENSTVRAVFHGLGDVEVTFTGHPERLQAPTSWPAREGNA